MLFLFPWFPLFTGNPNAPDNLHGCTATHYAAKEGHADCLQLLVDYGGRYDVTNNEGETPMDMAEGKCQQILEIQSKILWEELRLSLCWLVPVGSNNQGLINWHSREFWDLPTGTWIPNDPSVPQNSYKMPLCKLDSAFWFKFSTNLASI